MKAKVEVDSKGHKSVINACAEPCAIEKGMRILGAKWKGSIIYHLKDGPVRFNDLSRMLGGASKKMVDQRLKELESENMVIRRVLNDKPLAVSYELTEFGKSALSILDDLRKWSENNDIQLK
ncbi:winged helix-turn-helix transcriptional regulator [Photobacterium sp. DNB23_23_1]|uniref:Helix-turn-helix transcriptional regulator n=1 Tax=Photobacterium pectinilyticum TaxID=2906793 RepID=A0ABT1N644_9GAMM|nr:helix-turn-helix domain-containing protein [Photobacterium sp. ZSDE20]MCQ1060205.1 helix-turn-helix transcriptional regulator [Photobacterium sp. ZSDE20]MDD1827634.1 helix-turn-helix transcriptional regulator [Photobacterium sp. ZSDE20]